MAQRRILIVTERFYPEEFLINDLVLELKNRGYYLEILTQIPSYPIDKVFEGYTNSLFSIDKYEGIIVHRVKTFLGYKRSGLLKILGYISFAFLTWIKAFKLGHNFDMVFFYHTGPATMAHAAHVFKKKHKLPCYIWTQDIWPDAIFAYGIKETKFRRSILELYLKRLYSNFNNVLVSCRGFKDIIETYYRGKIIHIPQWYPGEIVDSKPNVLKNKLQFTFLGNIGSVQNLENVCLGFIKALDNGLNAQFNIVGDGVYLEKLEGIIDKYLVKDIILWGRRPANEMQEFIDKSNVMVISLKDDPLFNMYVPAKFQGYLVGSRPIYGVLNGEVADIISRNKLGIISNPGDIDKIAQGFSSFGHNTSDFKRMGGNSQLFYAKNYKKDNIINSVCYLLDNEEMQKQ